MPLAKRLGDRICAELVFSSSFLVFVGTAASTRIQSATTVWTSVCADTCPCRYTIYRERTCNFIHNVLAGLQPHSTASNTPTGTVSTG